MEAFDYFDESGYARASKVVVNYELIRKQRELKEPVNIARLSVLKLTTARTETKLQLAFNPSSIDVVRKSRGAAGTFDEITGLLRSNFRKKLKKPRQRSKATQTRPSTSMHDSNTVLRMRICEKSVIYINLINGFSSFRARDLVEPNEAIQDERPRLLHQRLGDVRVDDPVVVKTSSIRWNQGVAVNSYLQMSAGQHELDAQLKYFNQVKISTNTLADLIVCSDLTHSVVRGCPHNCSKSSSSDRWTVNSSLPSPKTKARNVRVPVYAHPKPCECNYRFTGR